MQRFPPECAEFFIVIKVLKILPGIKSIVLIFYFCFACIYLFQLISFWIYDSNLSHHTNVNVVCTNEYYYLAFTLPQQIFIFFADVCFIYTKNHNINMILNP